MKEEKFGVGTKHTTSEGCEIEIVGKINVLRRRVRFENGYEVGVKYSSIGTGKIKNPYHPSVYNVGYYGVGDYKAKINGKITLEYDVWRSMIHRCYDKKCQEKHPTYKGVVVCEKWHNFQIFAQWYNENCPRIEGVKFQLDKDLLQQEEDNKIYSPDTCVFLPHSVNNFLANKLSTNTSGYTGVSWNKKNKKWQAEIMVFGEDKKRYLGKFTTLELASQAYQQARAEQSETVKDYLRSLNYLSEDTIQLIK